MDANNFTPTFRPATIVTSAITSAMWDSLFVIAIFIDELNPKVIALTWLICVAGNILGIPLGMLASLFENEGGHF